MRADQRVNIVGPETGALSGEIADVKAGTPNATDYGLVTRNIPSGTQAVSGTVTATPTGTQDVNVLNSSIPVTGTFYQSTQPVSIATMPSTPVTGTFWQATQPISGTVTANQGGTWTVQPGNTANTTAWKVDGSAVTQPVSGTVTANAGTNLNTSALALSATQTDRSQKAQITDGTRDGTVKAASTLPAGTDTALVVTLRESLSTPVTGTFWQTTQPVSLATAPSTPVTNANLDAALSTLATSANQTTGNTSLASIDIDLDDLRIAQGTIASSTQKGPIVQGVVADTPQQYIDSEIRPLSMTQQGRLRVSSVQADIEKVWQNTFNDPWNTDETGPFNALKTLNINYV